MLNARVVYLNAISVGVTLALFATSASASTTTYVRCDTYNLQCLKVHCDDETGHCSWANGYSDRYGAFMRAEYNGYFHSGGRWLCVRGDGCQASPEPPTDQTRPTAAPLAH